MKILVATVTAGAGHLQAASALEEAWRALRPKDGIRKLDILDFTPRLYRKVYAEGYLRVVERAPELYAYLFKKTDDPARVRKLTRLRRALARAAAGPFLEEVRRWRPSVVLCPHFLPLELLGGLAEKTPEGAARPLAVCVVTDFEAHALWLEPCVDLYCVAAEETKARLVARGVPPERILATGIPVSSKFSRKPDARALRRRLGLRGDLPLVLVLGGGFGVGPVTEALAHIDKARKPLQTLVVAGRNESLRRRLSSQDRRHPSKVLGFVSNMHELMSASDLIVSKPGGMTSSEALALGRPLCVIDPIPGQEAANSDFLLEHGAAVKVNRIEDLPFRLDKLLGSAALAAMARRAAALGRPQAARDVCRAALRRLKR